MKPIDEKIAELRAWTTEPRETQALRQSVQGIGPRISSRLIARLPELGQSHGKASASRVG